MQCHNCEDKCGKGKAHPDIIKILECKFQMLQKSDSKSLLKKYLTPQIFDELKVKRTKYKMTLLDCIQTGFENLDSSVGVYAACPHSYELFADLFDSIIQDYHGGFKKSFLHPPSDFGDPAEFDNLDPDGQYIISTRVRTARSLKDYPFNPGLTQEQYMDIENKVVHALRQLTGEVQGQYVGLCDMPPDEIEKMIEEHYLFKEGDRFLNAANAYHYWPSGRGYFYNPTKTFIVWVNEEDHMRIISLQNGGNLAEVYERLINGITELERRLEFAKSERFGYLTMCPTNLGTTIRASVHIKLPKLSEDSNKFKQAAEELNLQIRGTGGEHTESREGVFDVSNKRRLGITEFEVIKEMYTGIKELIRLEEQA